MKKITALAFLFCFASTIANAQIFESKKPITCGTAKIMLKSLTDPEINERPIWIGTSEDSKTRTIIFVNNTTLSWTVLQLDDKIACVLNTGEGYSLKIIDDPNHK